MDGSYANPYNYGQSSLSPNTPSGSAYQVNINRQKTRKWVEAKTQNYDGDDWGADEFDDDDEPQPPPPPVSRVTTGLRPVGQRLPSEIQRPSERLDLGPSANSRSASGPPSLQIQTQALGASAPAPAPVPVSTDAKPAGSLDRPSVGSPLATNQFSDPARGSNSSRNASPANVPTSFPPRESSKATSNSPGGFQAPEQKQTGQASLGLASPSDIDRKRSSVSPQLPDVARMSFFGPDLFSPSSDSPSLSLSSGGENRMSQNIQQPGDSQALSVGNNNNANQSHMSAAQGSLKDGSGQVSPISQNTEGAKSVSLHENQQPPPVLLSTTDPKGVPPLRTPSPHSTEQSPAPVIASATINEPSSTTSSQFRGSEITPTEPLQPRKSVQSLSGNNTELRSFQIEPTLGPVTSSPVKESDVLSEEILRSLSSAGPALNSSVSPTANQNPLNAGQRRGTRESTYSLSDYDNYWAESPVKTGTEDRNESVTTAIPATGSTVDPIKEAPRLSPQPRDPAPTQPPPVISAEQDDATSLQSPFDLRRRFSWEMAAAAAAQNGATSPDPANAGVDPSLQSPPPGQSDFQSSENMVSELGSLGAEPTKARDSPSIVLPGSGPGSHQVSNASTPLPPAHRSSMLEPPSPISVLSDQNAPQATDTRRLSLADEKALVQTASNPISPTPPPEDHPALTAPPAEVQGTDGLTEAQLMSFKDIMGMPSPADRIQKYEETRRALFSIESGLENWITNLKCQHPEYATVSSSYQGGTITFSRPGVNTASAGSQPPAQQPYYQQYLNASSPTAAAPPSTRSRLGGLPVPLPGGSSSGFGNSSNQIGTKSKEFMHSAGKMGKGLFSKGKSKLRGTGDKDEPIPPPQVQPKPKPDRRMSWGLSLGPRSRADRPASHSNEEMIVDTIGTPPTHLPRPTRMNPSDAASPTNQQSPSWALDESQILGTSQNNDTIGYRGEAKPDNDDEAPYIPTPIDHDQSTWDPFAGTSLAQSEGVNAKDSGGVPLNSREPDDESSAAKALSGERSSDEWVMISSQENNEGVHLGTSAKESQLVSESSAQRPNARSHRKSEPIISSTPQHNGPAYDEPKRNSSFVGLPPIRRGSTFGGPTFALSTTAARPTTERFSFDEQDESQQPATPRQPGAARRARNLSSPNRTSERPRGMVIEPQELQQEYHPRQSWGPVERENGQRPDPRLRYPPLSPLAMHPPNMPGNLPPFGASPLVQSNIAGKPIQHMPPSGPPGSWKLEESHLTEPLHSQTRNRAGTGGSQQQPYSFNKETGLSSPEAETPPPQQTTPRLRNSVVPPSSAQRYPDLFRPTSQTQHQRPRSDSKSSLNHDRPSMESNMSRREEPKPSAFRGDNAQLRRGSGLFKDLGNRFSRVTSPENRNSNFVPRDINEQIMDMKAGEVSESSSIAEDIQDQKKRRSSFMLNLRGNSNTDRSSQIGRDVRTPRLEESANQPGAHERKHSLFGAGLGGHLRMKPGSISRSSTSSAIDEPVATNVLPSSRKRFSTFGGKSGVGGMFHRSSHDHTPKPGTSHSINSVSSMPPPPRPWGGNPQDVQLPGSRRSSTAGHFHSVDMQMSPSPAPSERHRRRGSAANFLSGILGHNAIAKPGNESQGQPTGPLPVQRRMTGDDLVSNIQPVEPQRLRHVSSGAPLNSSEPGSREASNSMVNRMSQQPRPSPLGQDLPMTQGGASPRPNVSNHTYQAPGMQYNESPQLKRTEAVDRGHLPSPTAPLESPPLASSSRSRQSPNFGSVAALNEQIARELGHHGTPPLSPASSTPTPQQPTWSPPMTSNPPAQNLSQPTGYTSSQTPPSIPQVRLPSGYHNLQSAGQINAIGPMPQASNQDPRFSMQSSRTSGPQVPPKDYASPPTPVHTVTAGGRLEGQGSKWKGLRHRVTGQITNMSQQGERKAEGREKGDKGASTKFLGAFKRASRQQTPSPVPFISTTPRPVSSVPPPATPRPQQPVGQPPFVQYQHQPQHQPPLVNGNQRGDMQQPVFMQGHPIGPEQGYHHQPQAWHNVPQQGPIQNAQQPSPQPFFPQEQQRNQQQYEPAQAVRRNVEPQYGHVPIPRGYQPVRSEGTAVPSQYNMKTHNQYTQEPHQDAGPQPSPLQQVQQPSPVQPRNVSLPLQGMSDNQQLGGAQIRRASDGPGQMGSQSFISPVNSHEYDLKEEWSRPGVARVVSDESQHWSEGNNQHTPASRTPQDVISIATPPQGQAHTLHDSSRSSPDDMQRSTKDTAPTPVNDDDAAVTNRQDGAKLGQGNGHVTKAVNRGLVVDVDKAHADVDDDLYDATPRLVPNKTGDSHSATEDSGASGGAPAAELEDTTEAWKRKKRLESQEEKIFFDPDQDSDGEYAPQMSATSYPGQEWNPYGVPEYGEWNDKSD